MIALLAASPEPLSGGAGWLGAGLLGLVLGWLLLKHLPEKDRLILDLMKQFREEIAIERSKCDSRDDRFTEALRETSVQFVEAVKTVVKESRAG